MSNMKMPAQVQCASGTFVVANGKPYFANPITYAVEVRQCVPYDIETVRDCIGQMDSWQAGPLVISQFLWAMRESVIAVGHGNGVIIDPGTITLTAAD